METRPIKVDDLELPARMGRPVSFEGKHALGELAGIDLDFRVGGPDRNDEVEEVFARDTVWVEDPFIGRRYEAIPRIKTSSYRDGDWQRHYTAELSEVDRPPEFSELEIEGDQFAVLRYAETDEEEYGVGRHALLQLSEDQFRDLGKLMIADNVTIRRLGVDEHPIAVRWGGAMYWSQHDEHGGYYKQIVRFYPPDLPGSGGVGIASGVAQDNLIWAVRKLSIRFEALLADLTDSGVITPKRQKEILNEDVQPLLEETRRQDIAWQFDRVGDAEELFD